MRVRLHTAPHLMSALYGSYFANEQRETQKGSDLPKGNSCGQSWAASRVYADSEAGRGTQPLCLVQSRPNPGPGGQQPGAGERGRGGQRA